MKRQFQTILQYFDFPSFEFSGKIGSAKTKMVLRFGIQRITLPLSVISELYN